MQLENAKVHNTISEDEAAVANGKLMIKQTFLGIVTTAALSYLRNELDKVTTGNAMLRANYLVTNHDTPTKNWFNSKKFLRLLQVSGFFYIFADDNTIKPNDYEELLLDFAN